jgi:hypothetical protein
MGDIDEPEEPDSRPLKPLLYVALELGEAAARPALDFVVGEKSEENL